MTPDQLLTFACVADTGNISRAAQTLHLSQPAVRASCACCRSGSASRYIAAAAMASR